MRDPLTRRGFIRTAAAGSAAFAWLGAGQAPKAFAAEAGAKLMHTSAHLSEASFKRRRDEPRESLKSGPRRTRLPGGPCGRGEFPRTGPRVTASTTGGHRGSILALLASLTIGLASGALGGPPLGTDASSAQPGYEASGAMDGTRFTSSPGQAWRGEAGATHWWWQVDFGKPRRIGAILQIQGSHAFVFTNAPTSYVWLVSSDGRSWTRVNETAVADESRLFRLHRLRAVQAARYLRLQIDATAGSYPTLREVEVYADRQAAIRFPDWVVVVSTTEDPRLPGGGQEFIPLAQSCAGWGQLQAQQVWLTGFTESFLAIEPRPLCAFLSGNSTPWCKVNRELWRGTQNVLQSKLLPMWASCGGMQGLALLSEYGVDRPWDCPHCRDPQHPKTPIYTHIGHNCRGICGDNSACESERGVFTVRQVGNDPVFAGLREDFSVVEYHCGQIEWPPARWGLIATAGPGAKTMSQCLRLKRSCIYAAQFHIEWDGTPEDSRRIMANFLTLAQRWGGHHPTRKTRMAAIHDRLLSSL